LNSEIIRQPNGYNLLDLCKNHAGNEQNAGDHLPAAQCHPVRNPAPRHHPDPVFEIPKIQKTVAGTEN
jgi:hypothetical protein